MQGAANPRLAADPNGPIQPKPRPAARPSGAHAANPRLAATKTQFVGVGLSGLSAGRRRRPLSEATRRQARAARRLRASPCNLLTCTFAKAQKRSPPNGPNAQRRLEQGTPTNCVFVAGNRKTDRRGKCGRLLVRSPVRSPPVDGGSEKRTPSCACPASPPAKKGHGESPWPLVRHAGDHPRRERALRHALAPCSSQAVARRRAPRLKPKAAPRPTCPQTPRPRQRPRPCLRPRPASRPWPGSARHPEGPLPSHARCGARPTRGWAGRTGP